MHGWAAWRASSTCRRTHDARRALILAAAQDWLKTSQELSVVVGEADRGSSTSRIY